MNPDFGRAADDCTEHRADTACAGQCWHGFDRPRAAAEAFDREPVEVLAERFPEEILGVPHRVLAILARPPAAPATS